MSKSDYLEGQVLDHVYRTASFTKPSSIYVGLFVGDPTDTGGGGAEVSGGNYARVEVANSNANWSRTGNQVTNANDIVFPAPTGADWGLVSHFATFDAAIAGNVLHHGSLAASQQINDGQAAPKIPAGSCVITED